MEVKNRAQELQRQIVAWRRALHRIPEVGFDLPETEAFIVQELTKMGLQDIRPGLGDAGAPSHGVCATLHGALPGKTLALRADMDALPIAEETGLPFASDNGNMHACGHDAHMAMLLGAAQILSESKSQLRGAVRFIFQPAEEINGARSVIAAGALEAPQVDAIIGLHTGSIWGGLKPGQIGWRAGAFMAASESMKIALHGKGGHGATPQLTVDPIVMASRVISRLQTIASREVSPFEPVVITIGQVMAGSAFNIIANSCEMKGTIRSFAPDMGTFLRQRITAVVREVAESMRGSADVEFLSGLLPVINDPWCAKKMRDIVSEELGSGWVCEVAEPASISEDFCWYLQKLQGAFFAHCSTFGDERDYPHHHPKFDLNESVLWTGCCALTAFALKWQC